MNNEWLALVMPLTMLLILLTCSFFLGPYCSEDNMDEDCQIRSFLNSRDDPFLSGMMHRGIFPIIIITLAPFFLFGFFFGYFQSKMKSNSNKWFGNIIAVVYMLTLFGVYRLY